MSNRQGSALVELLTVAALLGIILAISALLLHAGTALLRNVSEHTATDETLRTAGGVVRNELRDVSTADLHAVARDSVAARVFRGWGIVCGNNTTRVYVRYHGLREPDAEKDSLLVATEERAGTFRIASDRTARCPLSNDEQLVVLTPSIPLHIGNILLWFESGAYHIASNALRYRRGSESRQPLTDDQIDQKRSYFQLDTERRGIHLFLRASGNAPGDSLLWDSRFRFLN